MTLVTDTTVAGGATPPATTKVWDPFVRMFHWSLAGLFAIAFLTGDEVEWLHLAAGYGIVGLLAFRTAWGFIGPRHARFADFVRPPREVLAYVREVVFLRPRRYIGHNPAGGMMVVALLIMLVGISVTGYMMTTDEFWGAKWVEEAHEALSNAMLGLIALHVLGVIVSSLMHGENLVKAMFTGRKRP